MVEADRGIKADNMSRVTSTGAKVIGWGSGIFKSPDYVQTIHRMRKAAISLGACCFLVSVC
jgi:pentose-5-phosphate-3-epimerase